MEVAILRHRGIIGDFAEPCCNQALGTRQQRSVKNMRGLNLVRAAMIGPDTCKARHASLDNLLVPHCSRPRMLNPDKHLVVRETAAGHLQPQVSKNQAQALLFETKTGLFATFGNVSPCFHSTI
jgi:hypothetical protein